MTRPDVRTPAGGPANAINTQEESPVILPLHEAPRHHEDAEGDSKRTANLRAAAAMAGIALYRLDDGRWLATRWNLTREIDDAEVERWLERAGVAHVR